MCRASPAMVAKFCYFWNELEVELWNELEVELWNELEVEL
jgi:hypothetical protein